MWTPEGVLPPSVLPAERLRGIERILTAPDAASRRRAFEDAAAAMRRGAAFPGQGAGAGVAGVAADTVRILALRVDFLVDGAQHKSTGAGRFDLRRDEVASAIPIDPPPHDRAYFEAHLEALARYYRVMSGGTLELVYDVFPAESDSAYHLPDTRKYGPWIFSNSNPDVLQHAIDLVGDALSTADSVDASIDFSRYQSFLLFHAGPDFQGDINGDTPWDIPSFNLYVEDPFVVQDSIGVNLVMVVPETVSQDGFLGALNGVTTHEFGHQLGFFDLYDVRNGLTVVGAYSLMDSGENLYGFIEDPVDPQRLLPVRGTLPGSLDPWHKRLFFPAGLDLVTPEDFLVADSTRFEVELPAIELSDRLLYIPMNLSEELLVENRIWDLNADSTIILRADPATGVILGPEPDSSMAGDLAGYREYDYLLPGQGVVVWHVDWAAAIAGLNVPFGGINIFFSRPGVAVVEADGIRDIGTASTEYLGGPYDPYFLGGYTCLGPHTIPNSDTNDGTPTGITLCALDSIAVSMRVSVELHTTPAGWPVVVAGEPGEEQLLALDLSPTAGTELLAVSGRQLRGWFANGVGIGLTEGSLFWAGPAPIEPGIAGTASFRFGAGPETAPAVAAVSGGVLHLLDRGGAVAARWPQEEDPGADSLVTSTPVFAPGGEWVLFGCADGAVRGLSLRHGLAGAAALRMPVAGGPVRALGTLPAASGSAPTGLQIFWAAESAETGSLLWNQEPDGAPQTLFTSPSTGLRRVPVGTLATGDGGPSTRYLFAWEDGSLEWRDGAGDLLPGWPAHLGATPAGAPILCDADADGVLETMAADREGRLHAFGWNGQEEYGWPARIWSEDVTDPWPQRSGPRALDLDGDGAVEVVLLRADGMLLVYEGDGSVRRAHAFGSGGVSGPAWVPGTGAYASRLAVVTEYGVASDGTPESVVAVIRTPQADAWETVGAFPVAGFDYARTRAYPPALVPEPEPAADGIDDGTLRIYPNPLRGDAVTVRFVVGQPARVHLDAFDLAGHRVASLEAEAQPGATGNHLAWDLSGLESGLYQIRFRVHGESFQDETFQKLAIVR